MKPLDPKSKAATILFRKHTGAGYSAGPEFPGDTIRKAINQLFALGYLGESAQGRMIVTAAGRAYLDSHHLEIPS